MADEEKLEIAEQGGASIGLTTKDVFIATASTINCGLITAEANAAHIRKCWNSHDALLAACNDYQRIIEDVKDRLTGHDCEDLGIYDLDNIIEAAIALAK